MSGSALLVWSEELLNYDLGATHPMAPGRLEFTMALARDLDVFAGRHTHITAPRPASDDVLQLIHDPAYVAAVRGAPRRRSAQLYDTFGLGGEDNPIFARMHEASALVTGGTVDAARAVRSSGAQHAVNLAGGLHHAMPSRASGFCVYNDAAVAIAWLLADGVQRVAYVDVDAHHGDGVEAAFYGDPRVLTISLHESGYTAFPGTGFPEESGHGAAEGAAVNVALPPGTGDAGWLRAFHAVVPPLVRAFEPQILVTQLGCDTHRLDPLAQLNLTVDAHRHSYAVLHQLAHEVAGGRWVAIGGYEIVQVVPRSWTHLLAEITGSPLDPGTATPDGWLQFVHGRTGREGPKLLTDGTEPTYYAWDAGEGDPDDPVDRAIAATRRAVFPDHGLDHIDPR
ncbi:MAG: acetoin utilization protein AcuC [Pseudonocardiales bacterium]|nr:acetoin utilization protein AcuC [Pseudonocardiales bacterium]